MLCGVNLFRYGLYYFGMFLTVLCQLVMLCGVELQAEAINELNVSLPKWWTHKISCGHIYLGIVCLSFGVLCTERFLCEEFRAGQHKQSFPRIRKKFLSSRGVYTVCYWGVHTVLLRCAHCVLLRCAHCVTEVCSWTSLSSRPVIPELGCAYPQGTNQDI